MQKIACLPVGLYDITPEETFVMGQYSGHIVPVTGVKSGNWLPKSIAIVLSSVNFRE